ncbi:uncharacterized protein LOC113208027 [Frankliniella occidentalis]|uniref:Uncharacterized protein LOC113208027 n=1 Tax=Frankliniella occidentalis TaxID=133901 RepID=A0A6J1SQ39_FRAOC|nr:uncharacterized protein LOC113208027 [Frankliniella occidentalis]
MTLGVVCFALLLLLVVVEYRTPATSTATAASHYINNLAGPFRLVLDHIEACPDSTGGAGRGAGALFKEIYWHRYHGRKNGDLPYYWINATTLLTVDDSLQLDLNWASWSSRGGWKENAYVMRPGSFCKVASSHDPEFWRRFMTAIFDDPNRNCPFTPGYYECTNVSSEFTFRKIPVFFYGTWRVNIRLVKQSTQNGVFCLVFFVKTVPK